MGDVAAEKRRAAAAPASQTAAAASGTASGAAPASGTAISAPATAGAEAGTGGSRGFPVPPLDLPHYHGVGVSASPGGTPSDPDAVPRGTVKEVTGA